MEHASVKTTFSVDDIEKAKHFYINTLGFTVDGEQGEYGLNIIKDGQRFFMYPKTDHVPATFTLMYFLVDHIEQAMEDLANKGVVFEHYDLPDIKTDAKGLASWDKQKMAWFKDPAGNILGLGQNEQ